MKKFSFARFAQFLTLLLVFFGAASCTEEVILPAEEVIVTVTDTITVTSPESPVGCNQLNDQNSRSFYELLEDQSGLEFQGEVETLYRFAWLDSVRYPEDTFTVNEHREVGQLSSRTIVPSDDFRSAIKIVQITSEKENPAPDVLHESITFTFLTDTVVSFRGYNYIDSLQRFHPNRYKELRGTQDYLPDEQREVTTFFVSTGQTVKYATATVVRTFVDGTTEERTWSCSLDKFTPKLQFHYQRGQNAFLHTGRETLSRMTFSNENDRNNVGAVNDVMRDYGVFTFIPDYLIEAGGRVDPDMHDRVSTNPQRLVQ